MKTPWKPIFEELEGEKICRIPLSRGLFAVIDTRYLPIVEPYAWSAWRQRCSTVYYARTCVRLPDGTWKTLYLHKVIAELIGLVGPVDHKNGDGLDCRGLNLRPGPQSLNNANKRKTLSKCTSRYKGVSWYTAYSKWRAKIKVSRATQHLGYFVDEEQAARAYDKAALAAWGEYASLNFPSERTRVRRLG